VTLFLKQKELEYSFEKRLKYVDKPMIG